MKSDLSGAVCLVTGSARGIGQAIADRFAANGGTVYYSDLKLEEAEAAAFGRGRAVRLDVTCRADIDSAIERITGEAGRLDILVNNAGVNTMAHRVTIDQFPRSEWDRIVAVDLTGVYEMSQAAAVVMRNQGAAASSTSRPSPGSCRFDCSAPSPRRKPAS